ncbi:MAG: NAD(P)H-binding protein [Flavobacterium sp.]
MKVIITGSSGMIGGLVLEKCIQSDKIKEIVSLVRKPSALKSETKVKEVVIADFENYATQGALFQNVDMAFFCIGAYTGSTTDEQFEKITVNYAVAFAKELKRNSPNATLCMLSGAGADRTEKSKTSFARYKGMAENQISKLGLKFHTFRPTYIYPVTARTEPNWMYKVSRFLYPVIQLMGNNASIKSTELAEAMFNVGLFGADKEILENKDIKEQLRKSGISTNS